MRPFAELNSACPKKANFSNFCVPDERDLSTVSESNRGCDFGYKPLIFIDLRFRQAISHSRLPFLENTKKYFLQGTYDFVDLLAITIVTIMAYFVLLNTRERRKEK
jgi:hypothetical protein